MGVREVQAQTSWCAEMVGQLEEALMKVDQQETPQVQAASAFVRASLAGLKGAEACLDCVEEKV